MLENEKDHAELNRREIREEAKLKGKASFYAWLVARSQGLDPSTYERDSQERTRQKWLAYSDYVRYNEEVSTDQSEISHAGEATVSQVNFTLEDIKQLVNQRFTEEREYTRTLIREEVGGVREEVGQVHGEVNQVREEVSRAREELTAQFSSFIEYNFDPTMRKLDRRFDAIEDHLDQSDINIAGLKTDVRHIKQVLQIDRSTLSAPSAARP